MNNWPIIISVESFITLFLSNFHIGGTSCYDDTTQTQLPIENTHSVTHHCPYPIRSIGSVSIVVEAEDWIFISISVSVFRILEMKVTESRRGNMRMLRMQSRPCFQKGLIIPSWKSYEMCRGLCETNELPFYTDGDLLCKIQDVNSTVIAILLCAN